MSLFNITAVLCVLFFVAGAGLIIIVGSIIIYNSKDIEKEKLSGKKLRANKKEENMEIKTDGKLCEIGYTDGKDIYQVLDVMITEEDLEVAERWLIKINVLEESGTDEDGTPYISRKLVFDLVQRYRDPLELSFEIAKLAPLMLTDIQIRQLATIGMCTIGPIRMKGDEK